MWQWLHRWALLSVTVSSRLMRTMTLGSQLIALGLAWSNRGLGTEIRCPWKCYSWNLAWISQQLIPTVQLPDLNARKCERILIRDNVQPFSSAKTLVGHSCQQGGSFRPQADRHHLPKLTYLPGAKHGGYSLCEYKVFALRKAMFYRRKERKHRCRQMRTMITNGGVSWSNLNKWWWDDPQREVRYWGGLSEEAMLEQTLVRPNEGYNRDQSTRNQWKSTEYTPAMQ